VAGGGAVGSAAPSCPARAACGREEREEGERGRKKKKEKKEKEKGREREKKREIALAGFAAATAVRQARVPVGDTLRGEKGDGTVIEFGCRDRDSMGKVSGDLGFRDDLSPTIKNIFSAWFVLVNFRAVTNLPHLE